MYRTCREVLLAGAIELYGLLVGARPDEAQNVVRLEMPVVRHDLQGPLQQGKGFVVAAGLDPRQGFLIVRLRLGHGVGWSWRFRGIGKDRKGYEQEGQGKGCYSSSFGHGIPNFGGSLTRLWALFLTRKSRLDPEQWYFT